MSRHSSHPGLPHPGPSRPGSLVDFAFATLRGEIIRGELEAGTPLRLREHAARIGISPIPMREAMQRLENAGLVARTLHHGVEVTELSIEDMEDTYRVRIALEVLAIREAAANFNEEDDRLTSAWCDEYARVSELGDTDAVREAHSAFHLALYRPAESPWLQRLIPQLSANAERYRLLALQEFGTVEKRVREHRQLHDVCRTRRPDAAEQALRRHFERTQRAIRKRLIAIQEGSDTPAEAGTEAPAEAGPTNADAAR